MASFPRDLSENAGLQPLAQARAKAQRRLKIGRRLAKGAALP